MATPNKIDCSFGETDEIALTDRNELHLAKWEGGNRLRLYSYTQEDTFRERVGRLLHDGLQALFEEELLFDLEVNIDDKVFRCHRVVLASVSGYFRSLLTLDQHGQETGVVRVESSHVSPETFQGLLGLLYDGRDVLNEHTAMDLLQAATFLQMPALEYRCVNILVQRLSEKSCLKIWAWAEECNCRMLASKAKYVALRKFLVLRHTHDFLQMPLERLTTLLGHEMLHFRYEDDLLQSIIDWVEYDVEERRQYLKELLPFVCFPYLSTKYLNELRKNELIGLRSEFSSYLDEALTYHLAALQKDGKQIQMDVLRRQASSLKRLMPGMRRVMVLIGGCVVHGEPLMNVVACYFDVGYTSLTFSIASLSRDLGLHFASTVWKNDIYVSGGSRSPRSLMVYKPVDNAWHNLKGLAVGRQNHAMVALDNKIFLLGGRTSTQKGHEVVSEVSVYDIEAGTWEKAGDLPIAVEAAPAVVVGDKIYLLGGRDGQGRGVRAVQALDTQSGQMSVAGRLPQAVHGARAVVIGRDVILFTPDGSILKIRDDKSRGRAVTFAKQDSLEGGDHDSHTLSSMEFLELAAAAAKADSAVTKKQVTKKPAMKGGNKGKAEMDWSFVSAGHESSKHGEPDLCLSSSMIGKADQKTKEVSKASDAGDEPEKRPSDATKATKDAVTDEYDVLENRDDPERDASNDDGDDVDKQTKAKQSEGRKTLTATEDQEDSEKEGGRDDGDETDEQEDGAKGKHQKKEAEERQAVGGSLEVEGKEREEKPDQEDLPLEGEHEEEKEKEEEKEEEEDEKGEEESAAASTLTIQHLATMEKRRDFGLSLFKSEVLVVGGQAENGNFLDDILRVHVYTGQVVPSNIKLPIPLSAMEVQNTTIHQNYLLQFFDAASCFYGE